MKKKNVTISIEDKLLKKSKHAAVEEDKSLSEWIAGLIAERLMQANSFDNNRRSALEYLKQGFNLGGKPIPRDKLHER